MRMMTAIVGVAILAACNADFSRAQPPLPPQPPAPMPTYCTPMTPTKAAEPALSKWEHLTRAADHLEAAGLKEDAERIRKAAESERPATPKQVMVQVKMYEVNITKLRNLGADLSFVQGGTVKTLPVADVFALMRRGSQADDSGQLPAILKSLAQKKLASVLCEPNLMTLDGRSNCFQSGGYLPKKAGQEGTPEDENRFFGTELQLLPEIQADGQIRCDLRLCVSNLHLSASEQCGTSAGKADPPLIERRQVAAKLIAAPGQTLMLGGLLTVKHAVPDVARSAEQSGHAEREELQHIVLVTMYLVEPTALAPPPPLAR